MEPLGVLQARVQLLMQEVVCHQEKNLAYAGLLASN
jgi:hypothetical protein